MMEIIQINNNFLFENKNIKVIGTYDKPWFRGKDITEILEYKDSDQAIRKNVRDKNKKNMREIITILPPVFETGLSTNELNTVFINEPGLYELIMKSKKKEAIVFQDWVLEEVLPSIRKLGHQKYLEQLKEKDNEIIKQQEIIKQSKEDAEWLLLAAKKKVNFNIREEKIDCIYLGGHKNEILLNILKIGTGEDIERRAKQHCTSASSVNEFIILEKYKSFKDLGRPIEQILHSILEPLMIKANLRRREHFLINKEFANSIINGVIYDIEKYVIKTNEYVKLLCKNNFNHNKIENSNNIIEIENEIEPILSLKEELTNYKEVNKEVDIEVEKANEKVENKADEEDINEVDKEIGKHRIKMNNMIIDIVGKFFQCHKCTKIFASERTLKEHLNRKIACNIVYQCPKCNKYFTNNCSLIIHNVDKCNRVFQCNICEKIFDDNYDLKKHVNKKKLCSSENKAINFKCDNCNKLFRTENDLQNHLELKNSCNIINQCNRCYKYFTSERELNVHLNNKNICQQIFQCICLRIYDSNFDLKRHKKTCKSKVQSTLKAR